jgi:SAM-dependent methyltransferase
LKTVPAQARQKWQSTAVAEGYARDRFRGGRARTRDLRLVESLWRRHGPSGRAHSLLDLPCGAGRLTAGLSARAERYLGADISCAMLRAGPGSTLQADATCLPFADASFEVVVCCRLLHHLDPAELREVTAELLRVTGGLLIASFWDAATWPAWRRKVGLRRDQTGRRAVPSALLEECLRAGGGEVLGYARSFPLLSMQTFVAVRPRGSRR